MVSHCSAVWLDGGLMGLMTVYAMGIPFFIALWKKAHPERMRLFDSQKLYRRNGVSVRSCFRYMGLPIWKNNLCFLITGHSEFKHQ